MKRRQLLAGILFLSFIPAAALAAQAQSHSHEIEGLELRYLATKNPKQRKHAIRELKALTKNIAGEDAGALNQAMSVMLV